MSNNMHEPLVGYFRFLVGLSKWECLSNGYKLDSIAYPMWCASNALNMDWPSKCRVKDAQAKVRYETRMLDWRGVVKRGRGWTRQLVLKHLTPIRIRHDIFFAMDEIQRVETDVIGKMAAIDDPQNKYGTVDIRDGVPRGWVHIDELRVGPTAKAMGIRYYPAMVGFDEYRAPYGGKGVRASVSGVVVRAADEDRLRARLMERNRRAA